jgi:hypothetical protein
MMLANRPAVKFCLPFLLGIFVGWEFYFSVWYISGFLILLFIVSAISFPFYKEKEVSLQILIALILVTLGIFKMTVDSKYTPQNQINNFITRDNITAIEGLISDPPQNKTQTVQFVIESESVYKENASIPDLGGVLITIPKDSISVAFLDSLKYGTKVKLFSQLIQLGAARNPGEFDLRQYLHINGIYARIFLENSNEFLIKEENGTVFLALLVYPLRKSIGERLDKLIGGDEAKFL